MKSVGGNIWHNQDALILIPVNCVGVMGKGMVKGYPKAHPAIFKFYQNRCKDGTILTHACSVDNHVFLPTKMDWRDKSDLEFVIHHFERVTSQLVRVFCTHADRSNPLQIAVPKIGCGEGGLDWETQVRPRVMRQVELLEIVWPVEFYLYEKETPS